MFLCTKWALHSNVTDLLSTSYQWTLRWRRIHRLLSHHLAGGQGGQEKVHSDHCLYLYCCRCPSGRICSHCHVSGRSIHDGPGRRHGQRHYASLSIRSLPSPLSWENGGQSRLHPLRGICKLSAVYKSLYGCFSSPTWLQGLAGWTGYGCYFLKNQVAQWRLCLALQIVPPLCLLLGSPWLPESPRYLVANDMQEQGFEILKRLHHQPEDEDDTIAREELYQIRKQLDLEKRDGWRQGWVQGWILLFSRKSYRKRLLFGFLLL